MCTLPFEKWGNEGTELLSRDIGLEPLSGAELRFRPRQAGTRKWTRNPCARLPTFQTHSGLSWLKLIFQKCSCIKSGLDGEAHDHVGPPVQFLIWCQSLPGFLKARLGQRWAARQQKPPHKRVLFGQSGAFVLWTSLDGGNLTFVCHSPHHSALCYTWSDLAGITPFALYPGYFWIYNSPT